ncbi:MAG: long-chain-fatty-acid--CoA ligase [Sphingorhabdus sp.]|nr:long-chain-fatty-acid--CoA ligase [Sphingorhabdus sp.]
MSDGEHVNLPYLSFDEFIRHWSAERASRTALSQDDRTISFAGLDDATRRVVALLTQMGLGKGDRIAWLGKNSDLYLILFYGAARIGAVMVPIGWRLAPAEWEFIINDTHAKAVFTGTGFDGALSAITDALPMVAHIIREDDARQKIAAISPAAPDGFVPAGADDAVLQLYTSGTTGNPKGVVLSNRNLFALRLSNDRDDVAYLQLADDETVLLAMPCAHIGGTGVGVMALAGGISGHVLAEFTPDGFFDAVEAKNITRLFIVPAALQILVNHPRCGLVDYSKLKYILYGAAPMPLELLRECLTMFGSEFIQVYGMTETTGTIISLPPEDHDPAGNNRMRSAGKPLPGVEVMIVDEAGNPAPVGDVGELITRSTNNMLHYWKQPDATKGTMDDAGWIRTGDAAYLDADGYVYIHDRMKDMIITGGENVYPAQVESAIYGHPDIMEVAVIGVPHEKWGETVKAVCVAKAGHSIDPDSVMQWTRERLAGFKVPTSVDIIGALPRNASGKILRKDLRAPYWVGYDRMVN